MPFRSIHLQSTFNIIQITYIGWILYIYIIYLCVCMYMFIYIYIIWQYTDTCWQYRFNIIQFDHFLLSSATEAHGMWMQPQGSTGRRDRALKTPGENNYMIPIYDKIYHQNTNAYPKIPIANRQHIQIYLGSILHGLLPGRGHAKITSQWVAPPWPSSVS